MNNVERTRKDSFPNAIAPPTQAQKFLCFQTEPNQCNQISSLGEDAQPVRYDERYHAMAKASK